MSPNKNLKKARSSKNDEFYTQLKDIEKELRHYRHHFKDKIVYCNADDPRISNFFHYFSYNFEYLGLKKLITTCYKNQEMDLFSMHDHESAIALIYEGEKDNGKVPTVENIGVIELSGDGDFRSPEAVEFLEEADIIVTNPPFSLWREYVAQLIEYEKKFIIIGNTNAITYKEIFPYLKDNKMWIGRTNFNVGMYFYVPDDYEQYHKIENGRKMVRVSTSCWYTNLEHNKRNEQLVLTKFYEGNEDKYPYYDNYNAIEVGTYKDIPMDYDGVMGVPITFIDKYNPEQFEILGSDNYDGTPPTKKYGKKKRVSAFLFKSC
ncbi:adenine-specific methyltransferase EcoRI family protein [Enterococcus casseliflavus]|uniref:adenine-specific methyltransferase EcoRI family protein n=1 Tax=Enterococcus casseliflavus TaxID=37734 RepID=UPI001E374BCA|nr:adenine-specific methyltransferase EcoRI family protein [Enterococcus casseliflavus]MCD4963877.1 adenine-specific methyltransferase EcoRI family protein [Enterococcus casseliflavus]